MLKNLPSPPFKLASKSAEELVLLLSSPIPKIYFEGHFPDLAILPGVTLLHWTYTLAEEHNFKCDESTIKNLKFMHIVEQHSALSLTLKKSGTTLKFIWQGGDQRYCSGILRLKEM